MFVSAMEGACAAAKYKRSSTTAGCGALAARTVHREPEKFAAARMRLCDTSIVTMQRKFA